MVRKRGGNSRGGTAVGRIKKCVSCFLYLTAFHFLPLWTMTKLSLMTWGKPRAVLPCHPLLLLYGRDAHAITSHCFFSYSDLRQFHLTWPLGHPPPSFSFSSSSFSLSFFLLLSEYKLQGEMLKWFFRNEILFDYIKKYKLYSKRSLFSIHHLSYFLK